jgi:hypothetical protein
MDKEDSRELTQKERVKKITDSWDEIARKKGMKVHSEPMKGVHITFHPKPPVK